MSGLDLMLEPKPAEARRIEVITGWQAPALVDDEKAAPSKRRCVPAPWRRSWRARTAQRRSNCSPGVERRAQGPGGRGRGRLRSGRRRSGGGGKTPLPEPSSPPAPTRPHSIELDVAGSSVFIWRGAEPAMVNAIIGALKAAK